MVNIQTLAALSTLLFRSCLAIAEQPLVLIYSATAGFRHDSIPTAIQALKDAGPSHNVLFNNTEDKTWFTDETLAKYDGVLFLSTTGEGELFHLPQNGFAQLRIHKSWMMAVKLPCRNI